MFGGHQSFSVVGQEFPRRCANPTGGVGGANLLFSIIFAENCMKMKTSATALCMNPSAYRITHVGKENVLDFYRKKWISKFYNFKTKSWLNA